MKNSLLAAGLAAGAVAIGGSILYTKSTTVRVDDRIAEATVMITNMAGNSGGTGVVIESGNSYSVVLTNAHVCRLLKNGGKVISSDGKVSLPSSYLIDTEHDLCGITVRSTLPKAATVSNTAPKPYDGAVISGHPALLPTTVTNGHFGDKMVIQVFEGVDPCAEDDVQNAQLGLVCVFFGGIPRIKSYQSQFVTATIMAGSSGSGVYNASGELVGLAFAGSGEIGYAHTVPYSYVVDFRNKLYTAETDQYLVPNYVIDFKKMLEEQKSNKNKNLDLQKRCDSVLDNDNNKQIAEMCKVITDTLKWQDTY